MGHRAANISGRAKIPSKRHKVIRVLVSSISIPEHDPVVPSELAQVADVCSLVQHTSFGDFPLEDKIIVGRVRSNQHLKLKTMVPKGLWGASANHLAGGTAFGFAYCPLSRIRPRRIRFNRRQVTIGLTTLTCKSSKGLLLGVVANNLGGHAIAAEKNREACASPFWRMGWHRAQP